MFFSLTTYDPLKHTLQPDMFFIQSKGNHAGRPMREPKRNSWIVRTSYPYAFEICMALWVSKRYEHHIIGSVIPFLRVEDFKAIALPYIKNLCEPIEQDLKALQNIEQLLHITLNKLRLMQELKISTACHLLNKIPIQV